MVDSKRRQLLKAASGMTAVGTLGLAGCLNGVGEIGGSNEKSFNLANPASSSSLVGKYCENFSNKVSDKLDGQIKIKVFHDSQLGSQPETIEQISSGSLASAVSAFSVVGQHYKPISVFDMGYLYNSPKHAVRATQPQQSELMAKFNSDLAEQANLRILGSSMLGVRVLTANSEINKPSDINGLKIRAVTSDVFFELIKGMGGIPTSIPFSELPTGLSSGKVDGQENPPSLINASGLYEMQNHLMLTNHKIQAIPMSFNQGMWDGMSDEQQNSVSEAAAEASQENVDSLKKSAKTNIQKLSEHGMTVIGSSSGNPFADDSAIDSMSLERNKFQSQVQSHMEKTFPEWSDFVNQIQNI